MQGEEKQDYLPSNGTIVRVAAWRRQGLWFCSAAAASLAICVIVYAVSSGRPVAATGALGYLAFAGGLTRGAMSGVVVEENGIKARNIWKTYHWRWDEIDRFELREKGENPRFQVHLRNGQVRGFLGFYARSDEEEARAQHLAESLQVRLERDQAKAANHQSA